MPFEMNEAVSCYCPAGPIGEPCVGPHMAQQICPTFFFFGCTIGYRILVPWPGIEPMPPALEAENLNHWTTREAPDLPCFTVALRLGKQSQMAQMLSVCLENLSFPKIMQRYSPKEVFTEFMLGARDVCIY